MKIRQYILWVTIMIFTMNSSSATEITIEVTSVDTEKGGSVLVFIFGKEGFPIQQDKAILVQKDSELFDTMEFYFDINIDEIAVKVLHDEDNSGKVTKNWTGIYPGEGLGFSNDQKVGLTGPPTYEGSKVSKLDFEDGLSISVLYP